jgi:DnaJ-class molecular chaperone
MEFRDYYATLGVAKTATEKEIKQAYRKLARKLHPDVNPGDKKAEQQFKEINEAYEVLGDPEKRKKYDELGANWRMYEQAQQAYGAPDGGVGGWTVHVGGEGGQTFTAEEFEQAFGGADSPFSDFFRTFFGGAEPRTRSGRTAPRKRPGRDIEQEITLTLEEAFLGTRKRLAIKIGGHTRTVEVRIPPGVKDGARLRVAGEGETGSGGAAAGDLFLRIHLEPHPRFERRGQDLHATVQVPLLTAILGGEAEVPTLGGKALRLKIPEATQNGQVFRLRGHGMPATGRTGDTGDLYATIEVQLPRTLSPDARRHYEALAQLER